MIVGVGVDIVAVARIQKMLDQQKDGFLARTFTAAERDYCLQRGRPAESLAARFAAKEAVMKILGTGWGEGVGFLQVEVVRNPRGNPGLDLTGEAATVAQKLGIHKLHLSLSHSADHAVAFAVAEGAGAESAD
ncbi:MAG: holo-ACP synthase [Planctomycetota bacterium]